MLISFILCVVLGLLCLGRFIVDGAWIALLVAVACFFAAFSCIPYLVVTA